LAKDRNKDKAISRHTFDFPQYASPVNLTQIYNSLGQRDNCSIGENDKVFDLLERLIPNLNDDAKVWTRNYSDFNPLHSHPRWQTILKLMG
jgi:adenylate cyclase